MVLGRIGRFRSHILFTLFLLWAELASAACTSPAGIPGDQVYDSNTNVMVFCNGTNWVSMAAGAAGGGSQSSTTPGGSNTYVQYNNSGVFSGDSGLTYSGGLLTATNISTTNLTASGSVTAATFYGDGSHLTGISVAQGDRIISGTTGMVANGASSIISITSAGVTAGYFNSNGVLTVPGISATSNLTSLTSLYASGNVGIGTTSPNAKLEVVGGISASNVYVTGTTGTVSGTYGYFTSISATNISATGNVSAVKFIGDGSLLTGISGGSTSATTAVAFSVNKGGVSQTVTASAFTKLTWSTKAFDTNNNFASDRFTPTVAGKYLIVAKISCSPNGYICSLQLRKNGSGTPIASTSVAELNNYIVHPSIATVVDMNGTTDYLEVWVNSNDSTITGEPYNAYFAGNLLGPGQVTSGTASSGDRIISGSTSMVANGASSIISITNGGVTAGYFNSNGVLTVPGISATTNLSSFTTVYASGKVGIGTASPDASSQLEVASTSSGFLQPRMTRVQRDAIASPATGLMVYNTTANRPEYYNGSTWLTYTGMNAALDGTSSGKASPSCLTLLNEGYSTGDGLYYVAPSGGTGYQVYCDMTTDGGGWTLAKAALPAVSDANWFNAGGFTTTKSATLNSNAYAVSDTDIRTLTKTVYRVEGTCNNWSARTVGYADGRCDYSSPANTPNTYCRQWYSNVGLSSAMGTMENYGSYASYWGITDVHSGFSGSYITSQAGNKFALGASGAAGTCGGAAANSSLRVWVR